MEKISLPVIEPKTHHLSGLETADDISHLMTNLDSFLAETSLLNTLPNTQAQIDEIVKWLHERQLTATIDCLIEEFYSKEVKPEVIVQTFPFNKYVIESPSLSYAQVGCLCRSRSVTALSSRPFEV